MRNFGKLFISFTVLFLSMGMIALAAADKPKPKPKPKSLTKKAEESPFYLPSYVKQNLIAAGVFETEGYITFVYNPYNGQMHQRLIIVNEKINGPENTAIRIKIKDAQGLQKGDHYRFTVKSESGKTPQQPLELIEFTSIK